MPKYGATHKDKHPKEITRDFITKETDQEYARVTKVLGDCRFKLQCNDGIERIGHARGLMRKRRIMIDQNDVLLVGLRTFENSKCDIILKYSQDEIRKLVNLKAITISENNGFVQPVNNMNEDEDEDVGFTFEDI